MIDQRCGLARFGFAVLAIVLASSSGATGDSTRFPRGTFTLQTYGTYAEGLEARNEELTSVCTGVSYFVFDNLSLGLEASGYHVIQTGDDAFAGGIALTLRHHLLNFDRYSIFADATFGPNEANNDVPDDGTRFNFTTRAGLGAAVLLKDNLHLLLGARYFHLSNAQIHGIERNPSINGMEGYVGLMWTFD